MLLRTVRSSLSTFAFHAILCVAFIGSAVGQSPTPTPTPTPAPVPVVDPISAPAAKAALIAPKTFKPGRPIALQANDSIGDKFLWEISDPAQFLMLGEGRKQAFTFTADDATEAFAVEFVALTIGKDGAVTSFDSQVVIVSPEAAPAPPVVIVDPPKPPKPPTPPKPPVPPVAKAKKLIIVFVDQNTDRPKNLPFTKMVTDLVFLQSLEAAGHQIFPLDADNAAAAMYSKQTAAGLPAMIILNGDKINAAGAAPVLKSEKLPAIVDKAYVQKAVDSLTGKK